MRIRTGRTRSPRNSRQRRCGPPGGARDRHERGCGGHVRRLPLGPFRTQHRVPTTRPSCSRPPRPCAAGASPLRPCSRSSSGDVEADRPEQLTVRAGSAPKTGRAIGWDEAGGDRDGRTVARVPLRYVSRRRGPQRLHSSRRSRTPVGRLSEVEGAPGVPPGVRGRPRPCGPRRRSRPRGGVSSAWSGVSSSTSIVQGDPGS